MVKKRRPAKKAEIKESATENRIMVLIRNLIGTKKRQTFWDWLTSK